MFLARPFGVPAHEVINEPDLGSALWLDLLDPTDAEITRAETLTGLAIPTRAQLDEIESSSRQYKRGETLYLSLPLVRKPDNGEVLTLPIGMVLTEERIITVRYSDYTAFNSAGLDIAEWPTHAPHPRPMEILVLLLEAIVNRIADIIETLGRDLDAISRAVFAAEQPKRRGNSAKKLRNTLRKLGRGGDLASFLRDSLLALDRMGHYLNDPTHITLPKSLQGRVKTLGRDIASLNDYVTQTTNKVQFLLDATLGFINMEQNDGMKLLTVVSFVGVAPMLIAGVYGMNFKVMPELNWPFGYYYCLALIALSIAVPLAIFWQRGWFGDR